MKGMWEWIIGGGGLVSLFAAIFGLNLSFDKKLNRVYGRLDEHKKSIKEDFMQLKVCDVVREQHRATFIEIREALIRLEKKIDQVVQQK